MQQDFSDGRKTTKRQATLRLEEEGRKTAKKTTKRQTTLRLEEEGRKTAKKTTTRGSEEKRTT